MKRIKGGVLADGINTAIASVFGTFPNTTFSQNSGVIQLTGVASRYIGLWVAIILMIMGFFPIVGYLFMMIPKPVLGGATLVLFGTIAVAGIKILVSQIIDKRNGYYIIAISLGLCLGITLVPEALNQFPDIIQKVFGTPITL